MCVVRNDGTKGDDLYRKVPPVQLGGIASHVSESPCPSQHLTEPTGKCFGNLATLRTRFRSFFFFFFYGLPTSGFGEPVSIH